ncbi:GH24093 [Drosophila grimshawi]|uniref:GH24093 n=2 Tax=Drosophila grimshawi TaxID=7222 RepID=B4JNR0_DROGR|nr:GH24093 [Drosophila grimshawi]
MSEIIEFVMPIRPEYDNEYNNDGEDDEDADSGDQYVILDGVDVGREYKYEEFHLTKNDGDGDEELLLDNTQLHQQLIICPEIQQAMMRVPKNEYMQPEQLSDEVIDIVDEEEDELINEMYDDDGVAEYEEQYEHQEQQYEQYEDETEPEQEQDGFLYMETQQTETETEAETETRPIDTRLDALTILHNNKSSPNSAQQSTTHPPAVDDSDAYVECIDATAAELVSSEELAKPSDKMLDQFKGPRRYQLYDELIATIVDFDEDGTPIVEFRMIANTLDEKLPIECGICPDVMHKSKLAKHQRTHLVSSTNRYACIYCTETYRDCKYLAGHARRHMGVRPYVCEPCKLYFSTKQDLRVHNQRRHLKKEHICEMCGKTFAQNTQLKRHREATHEKKRRFQCNHCQKAYYKNFSLQEHIRNVHMGKRRMLKCPFCGMQCRDAHKMARHRKEMHLNQDTYVCHLCQEEFTDINYFDAHKRSIQCRSNTRRLVSDDRSNPHNVDGIFSADNGDVDGDGDELAGVLDEDFDEDAGLLAEHNDAVDGYADAEADVDADVDADADEEQLQMHNNQAGIYETTANDRFLHDDGDEQQQQHYDQNTYEDERSLVEQVIADVGEEQFLVQLEQQSLEQLERYHNQDQQQPFADQYNDDELIYEITLETEDN